MTVEEYNDVYGPPKYATVNGHNVHGNLVRDSSGNMVPETQLGITEINLRTDATLISYADGSQITGQTTFTMGGIRRRQVPAGAPLTGRNPRKSAVLKASSFGLASVSTRGGTRVC